MKPFRKIMVGIDFGASSRRALDSAVDIAGRYDAELVLVHAVEPFIPPYPIALMPEPGTFTAAAAAELEQEVARIKKVAPRVTSRVLEGDPADVVTTFAETNGADLLVLGTHGRRGPSRWLMGSVAEKIVRASKIPVLTVRAEA